MRSVPSRVTALGSSHPRHSACFISIMDVALELEEAHRSIGEQPERVACQLEKLLASGAELSDDQKGRIAYLKSLIGFLQGDFNAAAQCGYEALELYVKSGNRLGYANAAWAVGRSYVQKSVPGMAATFLEIALVGRRLEGDAKGEVEVLVSVAAGQASIGKYSVSLRCYELAAREAGRHGLPLSAATLGVAFCLLNLGRSEPALEAARNAGKFAIREKKPVTIAHSDLLICECLVQLRRFSEATLAYDRAAQCIQKHGFDLFSFELATCRGYILLGKKKYVEAEVFFRRALRIAVKRDISFLIRESLEGLIRVYRWLGDDSKELRYSRQLIKVFQLERKSLAMDSDIGGKIIALYDRNRASGAAKPGRRAPEGSALAPYLESLLKNVLVPDPDQRDVPSKAMRRAETLTVKQMNLLEQVARGLRNREIADELGVSPHTVRNNLVLIMRKLGAKSRSAAVALAYSKER